MDQLAQLRFRQRCRNRRLVGRRHPDSHLLLTHQQIGDRLGQILDALAQHAGRVPNQTPHLLLACLFVEALEKGAHGEHRFAIIWFGCFGGMGRRVGVVRRWWWCARFMAKRCRGGAQL